MIDLAQRSQEAVDRAERMRYLTVRLVWLVGTKEDPGPAAVHRLLAKKIAALGCIQRAAGLPIDGYTMAVRKHHMVWLAYRAEERRVLAELRGEIKP